MSRGLTGGMQSAIAAGTIYPILFGWFDFFGGAIYVCTHNQAVSWNAHTWAGLGNFVGISQIRETKEVRANGLTFTLNGIPSSYLTEVLTLRSRARSSALWLGCYNAAGSLIADPVQIFSGRMSQPTINDDGVTSTIALAVESRLVDLQRSRERRYTDADQQYLYPGDTGLQYVAALQEKEIKWGGGDSSTNPGAGGGSGTPLGGGGGGVGGPQVLNPGGPSWPGSGGSDAPGGGNYNYPNNPGVQN